jgi:hypothetical protein
MASLPVRDPIGDHLLTPQNAALIVTDYQPFQFSGVQSVDPIGRTSVEAHRAGVERVVQAGATPIGWVSLAAELQRDWAREETAEGVVEIVLTERLLKA